MLQVGSPEDLLSREFIAERVQPVQFQGIPSDEQESIGCYL